jgi:exosortase
LQSIVKELKDLWDSFPHKTVAAILLASWFALFHWLGHAGVWSPDPSLFAFLSAMYDHADTLESDDSLGRYIPWLALFLLFLQREQLAQVRKEPWAPALFLVAGALLLHVFAYLVQQIPFSFIAFLVGFYGLTGMLWGKDWLRAGLFLFVVLAFAMPIEPYIEGITFKMRHFAAAVSTWICTTLFSLNLDRQGAMVSSVRPDGTLGFQFEVAAACSGMRSLKVILLLTLIFGFLSFQSIWRRALLILIAPALAIAGNIVRLIFTFSVGEISPEYAKKFETNAGFVTFAVAFGGILLLGHWLREPAESDPKPEPAIEDPTDSPDSPDSVASSVPPSNASRAEESKPISKSNEFRDL